MKRTGLGLLLLAACAQKNEYVPPPPPAVTVAPPERRDVIDYAEFTGTTMAHKVVEVRARVKGFLAKIDYEPGSLVEKGTALFEIDPAEYLAGVQSADADLRSAQADLTVAEASIKSKEAGVALAETAVQKLEVAYKSKAVSEILVLETKAKRDVAQADLEGAKAQREVARARVGVAEAHLSQARLTLGYTKIAAPMSGRVAMWNVEVGALVGAGDPTLLTTIINDDKIYCHFDIAERWLLQVRKQFREATGRDARPGEVPVRIALVNEEGFPHEGRVDYADPTLDPDTGTVRVRAIFDNAERLLPSGAFVRVQVPVAQRKGALLVTERAVGQDPGGAYLLVVNSSDTVERRDVEIGARHGDQVVVLEGLRESERVIVVGLQRARPGARVRPEAAGP